MIKEDGTVIHFNNPKVQASLGSNVFAVTGHGETKGKSIITFELTCSNFMIKENQIMNLLPFDYRGSRNAASYFKPDGP